MTDVTPSAVYFHRLAGPGPDQSGPDAGGLDHDGLTEGVRRLVGRLGLRARAGDIWGIKVQLGAPGRPPAVDPRWVRGAVGALPAAARSFPFETLSITQEGLHTPEDMLRNARIQRYDGDGFPDLQVADSPRAGEPVLLPPPSLTGVPGPVPEARLAAGAAEADGLLLLSGIASHPHLGFLGAVPALGLGLSDRQGKLELHRDIRPRVDTPLCAGCGSCLTVCLFDAIEIRAGRAVIDHRRCTGCGACMTVCHMAGIAPEEAATIPHFQQKVALAAAAMAGQPRWRGGGRIGYINFLVDLNAAGGRGNSRRSAGRRHLGVLASTDPVALDQATWDLLAAQQPGGLAAWSGYHQQPGVLLETAELAGLGMTRYRVFE